MKLIDKVFERLTVLELLPDKKARCSCTCGREVIVLRGNLMRRHTRSCGCLRKDSSAKTLKNHSTVHGMYHDPLYRVWSHMLSRCSDKASKKDRRDYFERGITVCVEWQGNPAVFIDWGKKNGYQEGLEIDRRDNQLGYSPENCRFVTRLENVHNQRLLRSTNKSGYAGVHFNKRDKRFVASISSIKLGGNIRLGYFDDPWSACQARNKFIIENSLPHKIQEERV